MKWKAFVSLVIVVCANLICPNAAPALSNEHSLWLEVSRFSGQAENKLWASLVRDANYSAMTNTAFKANCERTDAPEALATPQPLPIDSKPAAKIVVSFIIGTDGQVHSPLIVQSAGPARDSTVLTAVRSWRFRPATCNGVPAEADGTVEFSRR